MRSLRFRVRADADIWDIELVAEHFVYRKSISSAQLVGMDGSQAIQLLAEMIDDLQESIKPHHPLYLRTDERLYEE